MKNLLTLEAVMLVNGLAIQHSSEWEDYLEMNAQIHGLTKEEYAAYYLGTQWQMQCMESLKRLTEKKVTRKQLDKAINDVAKITNDLKKVVKEWAAARDAGKTEEQAKKLEELKKLNDEKTAAQKVVDSHIQQLDKNVELETSESVNEKKSEFKEGDKVKLTLKGLQQMNRGRIPGISNDYSRSLGKIRDKDIAGTVERVFPSGSMNVRFDGVLYDIKDYMVVKESVNEKTFDKMVSKSKYNYDDIPSSSDLPDDKPNLDEPTELKNIKKFQKKYGTKMKVTTDNKPIGKRVTVYMEPGAEDGPDEIMEPQLKRHEEMMDFVKKHNLKISIADTVKGEWTFWTRYGIDESVNEAVSRSTKIYCVATPAPRKQLVEELEDIFGNDYRNIVTEFTDDEGYESVLLFNLTRNDIALIQKRVNDVLIWEYSIKKGKEIMESVNEEVDMDMVNTEYGFWGTMDQYEDFDSIEIAYEDAMNYLIGSFKFTEEGAYNFLNSKWGRKLVDEYYDGGHYNMVDTIDAFASPANMKKYARQFNESKTTMKNLKTYENFNEAAPKMGNSAETNNLLNLRDQVANAQKGGSEGRYGRDFEKAKIKALRAIEQMITYTKIGV